MRMLGLPHSFNVMLTFKKKLCQLDQEEIGNLSFFALSQTILLY
jgi:hypothetical protein